MPLPKKVKPNLPLVPNKTLMGRREELLEFIQKDGTYLPKSVLHADLDRGMLDFIKNDLRVVVEGKEVPTVDVIITTQNWTQYTETSKFTDLDYNPSPPFISLVRSPEVKYGSNPSLLYTIPNRRQYHYASVPTWNGNQVGMDIYTIPQPIPVDINYSLKIICNRMRELNQLNKVVMQKFSSKQAYTFIKGQYVPIVLNNISDESQMNVDARKYFVQSYDFIMLGYLIDEDEFEVKPAIQRAAQVYEIDTSSKGVKRKVYPENPDEFVLDLSFLSGTTEFVDQVDFSGDIVFTNTSNVLSYDVFINSLYFGTNVDKVQVSTNDILRIEIIKEEGSEPANIIIDNKLFGGSEPPEPSPSNSPTPTQTPTNTPTPTNTETPTNTPTSSETSTPTQTPTPTNTETPTNTPTPTNTETPTNTPTSSETNTPTQTPTPTQTNTETPTNTPTQTPTNTETPTNTPTVTSTPASSLLIYLDSGNVTSYPSSGSTWFDLEGDPNNATLINSPTFSLIYDGVLSFSDTLSQYATIPDIGNLNNWTVEVWFRITKSLTNKITSIISSQYDLDSKLNFSIGTNNSPTNYNLVVGFFDGQWRNTSGFTPQINTWYQVVGTYDGSVIRQYVNGVASGGTLNYIGVSESGGEIRLMRRWDSPLSADNLVDGDLSIVKIYNKALTSTEILENYNNNSGRFIDLTPTPTNTLTPTPTPTITATPSSTPESESFESFTFTSGGISGRTGPSLTQVLSSYDTTTYPWLLNTNKFNMLVNGIQLWTVPITGTYRITAKGAQGSPTLENAGGRGAIITGDFYLESGEKLQILVGQTASIASSRLYRSSAGGGGTFVIKYTEEINTISDILVIAGGGGGTGDTPIDSECDAQIGTTGGRARSNNFNFGGAGGTNGNGGLLGNATSNGAGGGFLTNGTTSGLASGLSFLNGGIGGNTNSTYAPQGGGFGGGGAPNNGDLNRFSGGGGFSGGGASNTGGSSAQSNIGGGGGSSYNSGLNQSNNGGENGNYGSGSVLIELL